MKRRGLRQLDLPVDPGLAGEGFTVILSAPRTAQTVGMDEVRSVADRVEAKLEEHFARTLPSQLFDRLSLEVGAGLIRGPGENETFEDVLAAGLMEAERSARAKYIARLVELGEEVEVVLAEGNLQVLYQPVLDLSGDFMAGLDCVPQGPFHLNLRLGDVFFDIASRTGLTYRAYDLYHEKALANAFGHIGAGELLFLKVSVSELLESAVRVVSLLYRADQELMTPANVVFLVGAGQTSAYISAAGVAFSSVRDMGFKLGVDVMADRSLPLDYWRELAPDFLRVSGRHVTGVSEHPDEFELVMMLARFAHRHRARIIAADVTRAEQFSALHRAGVDLVQGEYFAAYADQASRLEAPR
jgi:EAL domain-containing protein (putative c-di-GMP-specific phosphodiesterase class I)